MSDLQQYPWNFNLIQIVEEVTWSDKAFKATDWGSFEIRLKVLLKQYKCAWLQLHKCCGSLPSLYHYIAKVSNKSNGTIFFKYKV